MWEKLIPGKKARVSDGYRLEPHRAATQQGVKLTFFFGSHLAPKFVKVVANSKKLVAIMTHTHTKNTSHASINFLAKRDEN